MFSHKEQNDGEFSKLETGIGSLEKKMAAMKYTWKYIFLLY
jgi:hypothetical protein